MNWDLVCTFDEVGGTVSTFESSNAAHSEVFTVAHCGPCSWCLTWRDLQLQYTTRNYLAKELAGGAKILLVFGCRAVHKCLKEDSIGF